MRNWNNYSGWAEWKMMMIAGTYDGVPSLDVSWCSKLLLCWASRTCMHDFHQLDIWSCSANHFQNVFALLISKDTKALERKECMCKLFFFFSWYCASYTPKGIYMMSICIKCSGPCGRNGAWSEGYILQRFSYNSKSWLSSFTAMKILDCAVFLHSFLNPHSFHADTFFQHWLYRTNLSHDMLLLGILLLFSFLESVKLEITELSFRRV